MKANIVYDHTTEQWCAYYSIPVNEYGFGNTKEAALKDLEERMNGISFFKGLINAMLLSIPLWALIIWIIRRVL